MTKEIRDLLAVLDLPEDEQCNWLSQNTEIKFKAHLTGQESLADLAFRLRDEAVKSFDNWWGYWERAIEIVYLQSKKEPDDICDWWMYFSRPIHWIIAALIEKKL